MSDHSTFPGADLIDRGIHDLEQGKETVEALLVSIGAARLRRGGIELPRVINEADHRLYLLLAKSHGDDAHSQYNSLIRRLVSFEQAMECAS